ncbi:MAG: AsnC family transcriptional regulator, partial [Euryarchaeota archaeon]|nr:AsnC family transcriptional regulator [Euryarchaeota archaeon]
MDFGLDEKDAAIIAELCKDSRISVQSLAKTIGFPRVTV